MKTAKSPANKDKLRIFKSSHMLLSNEIQGATGSNTSTNAQL